MNIGVVLLGLNVVGLLRGYFSVFKIRGVSDLHSSYLETFRNLKRNSLIKY
jgi:hypothetical protein